MVEGDDVDLERQAGDLLVLDPIDLSDAVRRIDDVVADGKILDALSHRHSFSSARMTRGAGPEIRRARTRVLRCTGAGPRVQL